MNEIEHCCSSCLVNFPLRLFRICKLQQIRDYAYLQDRVRTDCKQSQNNLPRIFLNEYMTSRPKSF